MLTATQGKNINATQQYFETVLSHGDYYLGQDVSAQWYGGGTSVLGLDRGSKITADQFRHLLNGRHPVSGTLLAQRQRTDRRPGVDLTFSVPKSVSLAWAIGDDEAIVGVLREAVEETMTKDVEKLMARRLRHGKHATTKDRVQTGNLIYGEFLHQTSRPVDGIPDPHLHVHAFVLNVTAHEGKHFAGEFEEIIRQRASLQAKFEARLAEKLASRLGYSVSKVRYLQSGRMKTGWEIDGIDRRMIEKFSRRTGQIEAYALEHGITDATERVQLGRRTRENKVLGSSLAELRAEWRSRLTEDERTAIGNLRGQLLVPNPEPEEERALHALRYSLDHHLYRDSIVERSRIIGTALESAVTISPERMEQAFEKMDLVRRTRCFDGVSREFVTTREVLDAEKEIISFARDGRGTRKPIGRSDYDFHRTWLNDEQKQAVQHVLTSRDTVMAVMGGAGTGKSSLLEEAADAIRSSGRELYTFAPTTAAREVLQEKGFAQAQTVEHLLQNTKLHAQLKGQVLWVDESGLLDVRSMQSIFRIAREQDARVVLSGDTRQHASPRRGAAMRLLEREAGLKVARVETIQRQSGIYREAIGLLSQGEAIDERSGLTGLVAGFDLIDRLGKICEAPDDQRYERLAEKYIDCQIKRKSTLVVAPTHAEGAAVTQAIRSGLRVRGMLPQQEVTVRQLRSLNLTDAEKREAITYQGQHGLIVQFHQNTAGNFKKGERFRVSGIEGENVSLTSEQTGLQRILPISEAERFEIYGESMLNFAVGDKIRFTLGGSGINRKQRIANGRLDEIRSIDKRGNLILKSGITVSKDYGHFDLGYVVTSHASQGLDRQVILAAMSTASLPAINAQQFYVTASRGKEDVMIFVDDKARARQAIARTGDTHSATELVARDEAAELPNSSKAWSGWDAQRLLRRAVETLYERFESWWWYDSQKSVSVINVSTGKIANGIDRSFYSDFSPDLRRP